MDDYHAAEYGNNASPTAPRPIFLGYNEEKWHWSYLFPSQPLTALAKEKPEDGMITGFKEDG